ncbi:MAG: hypothetical protein ACRDJ1_01015 [Actinomycetota bacterium]
MRRALAGLVVAFAASLPLMPTAALADDVSGRFDPTTDRSAWYWSKQATAPAGDLGNVVPSPQAPGSLPVALEQGQPEKNAAVFIDLAARGVPGGATITQLLVTILEGSAASEIPGFEISAPTIRACPIAGVWAEAEAEAMTAQPPYDASACVDGRRTDGEQAAWTFDLMPLATDWDELTANRGFLLIGSAASADPAETWQVNLQRPLADDPSTVDNEYEATKDSMTLALSYQPAAKATRDLARRFGPALFGDPPAVVSQIPLQPAAAPVPQAPIVPTTPVATAVPIATLPQIVWILVPLGLTLIGVMSWIVWEPDAAGRPLWMRAMGFDPKMVRSEARPVGRKDR